MRLSSAAVTLGAALLFLVGGGAYALATSSGGTITVCVNHKDGTLYQAGKCARHDRTLTWNKVGPPGPRGATGPQGPGGMIQTYDANASSSPTFKTLRTVLGDTWSAECTIPSPGEAELVARLKTTTGAFVADIGLDISNNGTTSTSPHRDNFSPGTVSKPQSVITLEANSGGNVSDVRYDFVQTAPVAGHMVLNGNATTSTSPAAQTCHLSVETFPEKLRSVGGASPAGARSHPSGSL